MSLTKIVRRPCIIKDITKLGKVLTEMKEQPVHSSTNGSPGIEQFTKSIDLFASLIERREAMTPLVRRTHLLQMCDLEANREKAVAEIECFQIILHQQRSDIVEILHRLISDVASNKSIVKGIRNVYEQALSMSIAESDLKTVLVEIKRRRELSDRVILQHLRVGEIAQRNLSSEKQLASACLGSKERYASMLARFDREVGALSASADALLLDRDNLRGQLCEIQDRLSVQRTLHTRLREEHELALMETFLRELESFRRNHAARVIQRSWRKRKACAAAPKKRKARK
ncbi:hypothetical protein KM043_000231 [Ampulex compressa]|nr:hypothetical protein KM043_000231 [Ampulex compressa]